MRFSKQREAVYEVLRSTDTHPDVAWIYNQTRKIIPNISLGTVYRNLNELAAAGRIKRVSCECGSERFDAQIQPHAHFVCTKCGAITDVDAGKCNVSCRLDNVFYSEVTLYGICDECRAPIEQNKKEIQV